jgi:hypothetical protein
MSDPRAGAVCCCDSAAVPAAKTIVPTIVETIDLIALSSARTNRVTGPNAD